MLFNSVCYPNIFMDEEVVIGKGSPKPVVKTKHWHLAHVYPHSIALEVYEKSTAFPFSSNIVRLIFSKEQWDKFSEDVNIINSLDKLEYLKESSYNAVHQ